MNIMKIFLPSFSFSVSRRFTNPSASSCGCLTSDIFYFTDGNSTPPSQPRFQAMASMSFFSTCPGDPLGLGSSPSLLNCKEAISFSGTLDHGERVWRAEISRKWRSDISRIQGTSALVCLLAFLGCHSKVWGVVKLYVWKVWLVFQLQEVAVFIPFCTQLYINLLSLWTGVRLKVTLPW